MATYPTDMHTDDDNEPSVTNRVARCRVCGFQWQVQSPNDDDAKGCPFCDAGKSAIVVRNEKQMSLYGGQPRRR